MMTRRRRVTIAVASLVVDILAVVAFTASLRETQRDVPGLATASWPFWVGLAAAWLVARVWRSPTRVQWSGVTVWVVSAVVGMTLRGLLQSPMEATRVFVSGVALGVFLVGWRAALWTGKALVGARERVVDDKYRR